ncbi:MAG: adenosylmethionine decarboxylase [Chthonomonas sp.]|nr:adenosylmethionine decarboxylase [Chthonomonas sp.]
MEKIQVLSILAAFAASVPFSRPKPRLFARVLDRISRRSAVSAPPRTRRENGWTFVESDSLDEFRTWLERDEHGFPHKPGEEPSLGSHLLIELFDCDPDSLKLESTVGGAMLDAANASEATVVTDSFHEFKPYGVSGAVIIQESHYTIHTWPEHGYAAVDLFYCGGTIYVHKAMDVLTERFKPGRMKFLVVRRGVQSEVER